MAAALSIPLLAILGAAVIVTLFVSSPPGQKAAKDTAKALEELFERLKQPEPEPEQPKPFPLPPVPPVSSEKCPDRDLCPCCGQGVHSDAQKKRMTISEEDFYTPRQGMKDQPKFSQEAAVLLPKIRAGKCRGLLPDKGTNCSRYYIVRPGESQAARSLWNDEKRYHPEWKGQNISHRVPLVAGGCPIGSGNLYVRPKECDQLDAELTKIQEKAGEYYRKRPPLPPSKACGD